MGIWLVRAAAQHPPLAAADVGGPDLVPQRTVGLAGPLGDAVDVRPEASGPIAAGSRETRRSGPGLMHREGLPSTSKHARGKRAGRPPPERSSFRLQDVITL